MIWLRGHLVKVLFLLTAFTSVVVVTWIVNLNKGQIRGQTEFAAARDENVRRGFVQQNTIQKIAPSLYKHSCPHILTRNAGSDNTCRDQAKIVIYSKLFKGFSMERYRGYKTGNCKLPNGVQCVYTEDDKLYQTADGLYIHECFSYCERSAYPGQVTIRYNLGPESRSCNNPQRSPAADIRVSYKTSATIPLLYLCLPRIKQPILRALRLDPPFNRQGIAMFVSDCRATWRYKYLEELMKYISIDSFGKCLHNTVIPQSRKGSKNASPFDVKIDVLIKKRYKFLIAFENTVTSEYITEKIWHGYLSQTIPIYYGVPEVYEQVPGNNTFIDGTKFKGPKELAMYIKEVDEDEQLYQSFFTFTIPPFEAFQKKFCKETSLACDMCNRVYQIKEKHCH